MKRIAAIQLKPWPIVLILFTFIGLFTNCSFRAYNNPVTELTYYATEEVKTQSPPSFPGGHEKLEEFIRTQVKRSPNGVKLGRKIFITAKIDEKGRVIELKSSDNTDPSLAKELNRIAYLMPAWQAGIVNGKGVLTDYTFVMK